MALRNQAEQYRSERNFLAYLSAGLCGVLVVGALSLLRAADKPDDCYIPPDLSAGAVIRPGEVPAATVFAFAHTMWQQINRWPEDGREDYTRTLAQFQAYLTARFGDYLLTERNRKAHVGELEGRTRGMALVPGRWYEPGMVTQAGEGVWHVTLDMELTEYVAGTLVKRQYIQYPLRVVKLDIDRAKNPWKLALDGWSTLRGPLELKAQENVALTSPRGR